MRNKTVVSIVDPKNLKASFSIHNLVTRGDEKTRRKTEHIVRGYLLFLGIGEFSAVWIQHLRRTWNILLVRNIQEKIVPNIHILEGLFTRDKYNLFSNLKYH